jgi:hypothetical protein
MGAQWQHAFLACLRKVLHSISSMHQQKQRKEEIGIIYSTFEKESSEMS